MSSRVVDAATEMFSKFAKGDRAAIHPNIRGSVYGIVLSTGGMDEVRLGLNISRSNTSLTVALV